MSTSNEASIFVIFGSTGDLSMRRLLPALASRAAAGRLPARSQRLGLGPAPHTDESFRQLAAEVGEAGLHAGRIFARLVVEKPFGQDLASAPAHTTEQGDAA